MTTNNSSEQYHTTTSIIELPIQSLEEYEERYRYINNNNTISNAMPLYPSYALLDKIKIRTHLDLPPEWHTVLQNRGYFLYEEWDSWQNQIALSVKIQYSKWGDKYNYIFNPSHFSSFSSLKNTFLSIFKGNKEILDAKVSKLDCTVDIYRPFEEESVGTHFGKCRTITARFDRRGQTGYYVGQDRNPKRHKFTVYNKTKEVNKDTVSWPWTRYETNSFPKDITLKNLSNVCNHTPFKFVTRYNIEFLRPPLEQHNLIARYYKLLGKVEALNFWKTRQELNSNHNFEKYYGDFYRKTEIAPSLDEIFQASIPRYFRGE